MNVPVFDLHCDTALALLGETVNEPGSLRKNELHIDLERAKQLPGYCQCFACFTTPFMEEWFKTTPTLVFEREIATIQRELDKNHDLMELAYSAAEVEELRAKGKMAAILTIEGPAGFGFDPELLENLYQIGFRISTLGWNEKNPLTGSHRTGGGLTDMGRAYVKEAQRVGMRVDVSHISDEAFWDIMKITQAPIVATHSSSRAVFDSSRNLIDEQNFVVFIYYVEIRDEFFKSVFFVFFKKLVLYVQFNNRTFTQTCIERNFFAVEFYPFFSCISVKK